MAQRGVGVAVLYAHGAGGGVGVGDWLCSNGGGGGGALDCAAARDRARVAAAVGPTGFLCLFGGVWVGADLYSRALSALVLQRAVWDGDASGAGAVCAGGYGGVGATVCEDPRSIG